MKLKYSEGDSNWMYIKVVMPSKIEDTYLLVIIGEWSINFL